MKNLFKSGSTIFLYQTKHDTSCFETKTIIKQQLHLKAKHLIVWNNILYYPHSDINRLSTLDAMFTSLSHAQLTRYSTGANKVDKKPTIYCSSSSLFTMTKKSQNDQSFVGALLPLRLKKKISAQGK